MHVVSGMVQRREPPDGYVRLVRQLIRELEERLERLRVQEEPEQAQGKRAHHARALPLPEVAKEHDEREQERIEQHEQEDRAHALIWAAHLERFDERREGDALARAGIAQDGGSLRPHVADEALPHADEARRREDEEQVKERGHGDVERLPGDPGPAVDAHQIKRRAGGDERHVRKEQQQQERGKEDGVAVPERPDESLHQLHGRPIFHGEADSLVRKQEAEHEREGKREEDARVLMPAAEIVLRDGADLPRAREKLSHPQGASFPRARPICPR